MNTTRIPRTIFSLIYYIVIISIDFFLIIECYLTEVQQSLLMCCNFLYVLWRTWQIGRLSPFFLFLSTFCFLFIGGHFWGCLFNPALSIRVGSFMDPTSSSEEEWGNTLAYLILFLYASLLGYERYRLKNDLTTDNSIYITDNKGKYISLNQTLGFVFWPLAAFVLYDGYRSLMLILQSGYSVIYLAQSEGYSGNSLTLVLTMFFFAMAMVYGNRRNRILYLTMMFANGLIGILGGGRGAFGSFLLYAVWLVSTKWQFKFKKLFIVGGVALALLLAMSQMSKRAQDSDTEYNTINDVMALFVYSQGESLATFEKSREFIYPVLPYVQTFVPGSSLVYAYLFDPNLKNSESSFSLYLSKSINVNRFLDGDGTGWTLISDLYLFSGRTWIGYIMLSYLFGLSMALLECRSKTDMLYRVLLFAIFLRLMTLPRTGLNYICPLMVYVTVFYFIISRICNLPRR